MYNKKDFGGFGATNKTDSSVYFSDVCSQYEQTLIKLEMCSSKIESRLLTLSNLEKLIETKQG